MEWQYFDTIDTCPACNGSGCDNCNNSGLVIVNDAFLLPVDEQGHALDPDLRAAADDEGGDDA